MHFYIVIYRIIIIKLLTFIFPIFKSNNKNVVYVDSLAVEVNAAGRTQQQYWKETNKGLDKGTKVETIKNVSVN